MQGDPDFYSTFVSGTRDYRAFQLSGELIILLILRLIGLVFLLSARNSYILSIIY
jgi:hypothetical protein